MKRSWTWMASIAIASVPMLGCTPEATKKAEEMNKEAASAAKDAAESAKDAAQSAASAAQDAASAAKEMAKDAAAAAGLDDLYKKATDSLASVEGGEAMLKGIQASIGQLSSTLANVKDSDTAKAAAPVVTQLTETFGSMGESFAKLPDAAKGVVANIFQTASKDLKPMIDKVLALPGVEEVLKPALEALLAKLNEFKAS
ncbi:hypothetical protein VN12_14155 [Pirellula sp. SH-Sr6A]|uniref:hypothetical protein n=1 Tax=Pirellula sp. SH-Sr6A TaxID=1632865 RepID=UPI00078E4997|nr:hypothetical protein [Pirellula sp. SH-Sr6A]AMV33266.1 hypothetical protein VN12_14155 [Pirellula sp. SH-Sr6A]